MRVIRSRRPALVATIAAGLLFCGCAIANKAELHWSRNITLGQELLDLQAAHEAGALTDEEYERLKCKIMEIADSIAVTEVVEDFTPGGDDDDNDHGHDHDFDGDDHDDDDGGR